MCMCIHMEELKVIDELVKEATRINITRRKLKQLGFPLKDIDEMVDHFVVQQIKQPMED